VSAWSEAPAIKSVEASAFTIPTEQPERDGTLEWSQPTLLLVVVRAGDSTGIGYSHAHRAAAEVVNAKLAEIVCGQDPLQVGRAWAAMWRAVRNFGQTGLVSMAISAVDVAEAVVAANGFSCQTQLQQASGTGRQGMHLAQVMALARQGKSTDARRRRR
jgi:L-alanine-DL-glutamate epimerase-like enolase superfamily enzyme